jgi:hypothetical protein
MVYVESSIIAQPGKIADMVELVKKSIPFWEKAGMKVIGSWNTVMGNASEVTNIVAYEDFTQMQKVMQTLNQDKEYQALFQKAQAITVSLKRKMMMPNAASPLK